MNVLIFFVNGELSTFPTYGQYTNFDDSMVFTPIMRSVLNSTHLCSFARSSVEACSDVVHGRTGSRHDHTYNRAYLSTGPGLRLTYLYTVCGIQIEVGLRERSDAGIVVQPGWIFCLS